MPSRAAAAGPGGFAFYDHVFLPESVKDLTWAHEGRSYRSQIVVRLAGKRRTEAYLHAIDEQGQWKPVRLDDGTVSDGKIATYDHCVEAICGSADTFFTSVFAAQGKRALSAYRNAEIKALLADLLGQAQIQALGQKAADTARLLRAGLGVSRQEAAGLEVEAQRLDSERARIASAPERLRQTEVARQQAHHGLEVAQAAHAREVAAQQQAAGIELRRQQLIGERRAAIDADEQTKARLRARERTERERLDQLARRVAGRIEAAREKRRSLERSRQRCLAVLKGSAIVRRASRRLRVGEQVLALRKDHTQARREQVKALEDCAAAIKLGEQKVAALEREAGKAVLHVQDLARRFGLAGEVPCVGTDLQQRCKLLGDAREAQALVPSANVQVDRLGGEIDLVRAELARKQKVRAELCGAPKLLAMAQCREEAARARLVAYSALAAQLPACDEAAATMEEIEREMGRLGGEVGLAETETSEEREERARIVAAQQAVAAEVGQQVQQARSSLSRIDRAIAELPDRLDVRRVAVAVEALAECRARARAAEEGHLSAQRDVQRLEAIDGQLVALAGRRGRCDAHRARVEHALGDWTLFARCMSNDGLIALAIDDAGPELSALANGLLLASYGPRFTLSIQTLRETVKGDSREGFEILVHDAESDESKSLAWMSGGERTIIEACLTRAIALYLVQSSGRHYSTLFSDEADGALDPDRKRAFMAMKREVLELGGYEREFFISQTPELAAMADAVIDLDSYAQEPVTACCEASEANADATV